MNYAQSIIGTQTTTSAIFGDPPAWPSHLPAGRWTAALRAKICAYGRPGMTYATCRKLSALALIEDCGLGGEMAKIVFEWSDAL